MPGNVANLLAQYGVTPDYYSGILLLDPFANDSSGTGKPDPARFQFQNKFFYEPVSDVQTYKLSNNYTFSSTRTAELDVTAGASVSATFDDIGLKAGDKFTWTYSGSTKNTVGTSDSETLVLGSPGAGYTGPTEVYVYVDTVFKTFLFSSVAP